MAASNVALVTGAASGIGFAVTKDLLSRGWKVCLCDLNPPLEDNETKELGDNAVFRHADVADYDSLAGAFAAAWSQWGQLDFVFANAGVNELMPFRQLLAAPKDGSPPPKPDLKVVDINFTGVIYTLYIAIHYFRQNSTPGGKIVATASAGGLYALPVIPVYSATKHGAVGLVRALAPTVKDHNITINCLCPGVVPTGLTPRVIPLMPEEYLTPISTVVTAVNRFLGSSETGCVAELSGRNIHMRDQLEYEDNEMKEAMTRFGLVVEELRKEGTPKA